MDVTFDGICEVVLESTGAAEMVDFYERLGLRMLARSPTGSGSASVRAAGSASGRPARRRIATVAERTSTSPCRRPADSSTR
jgi:hypothetical protein